MIQEECSPREYNIICLLVQHEKGVSIDYLAKELRVSLRSIYGDMKNLKAYLKEVYDIEVVKKGKLYSLSVEDSKELCESGFEADQSDGFSAKPRKYQIIEYLATMKTTTLQEMADRLYVSKGTIHQEMKMVEKLLSKFSIHVIKKPYHGISIQGTELNLRFLLQYMLSDQIESMDLNVENMMFARKVLNSEVDIKLKKILEKYPSLDSTDMLICLSVMCHRVKEHHDFSASEGIIETNEFHVLVPTVRDLLEEVGKTLHIEFQEDEKYYVMININNYDVESENQEYLRSVLDAILKLIKEKYQTINTDESSFYTGLLMHIATMLKRMKFGKIVWNPVLGQTKESLPFAFNISADIAMMLHTMFTIHMNEDEIGLLAMHIQAMMEENQEGNDVKYEGIVASHIGYGNARMISGRLFSHIPDLNIKRQVSIEQMEALIQEERVEKDKIIISTSPLSLTKEEYLYVHPIISDEDIERVREYLKQYSYEDEEDDHRSGFLYHVPKEHIYVHQNFKTKENLLSFVCDRLYKSGYVSDEFYNSTLAREKISSTYALNGVALPHGYSKCVIKPGIAIVILDKPLDWDGYYADMVFVCALSLNVRESDQKIFEDMYTILNDREIVKEMKNCKTQKQIISVLRRFNEGEHDESK